MVHSDDSMILENIDMGKVYDRRNPCSCRGREGIKGSILGHPKPRIENVAQLTVDHHRRLSLITCQFSQNKQYAGYALFAKSHSQLYEPYSISRVCNRLFLGRVVQAMKTLPSDQPGGVARLLAGPCVIGNVPVTTSCNSSWPRYGN